MEDKYLLDKIANISRNKERDEFSAAETANSLLSLIKPREAQILRLRFGLDGDKPKTLASIGRKLNLTRERVRQLEKQAFRNISRHAQYKKIIAPLKNLVQQILKSHGGLMSIELISRKLIILNKYQNQNNSQVFLYFLLNHQLENIVKVKERNFKPSLKLAGVSMDSISQLLFELEKIFVRENKILSLQEIVEKFKASKYYQKFIKNKTGDKLNGDLEILNNFTLGHIGEMDKSQGIEKILFSYLDASQNFIESPFGQWGLSSWPIMTPRRINGKIYLVMLAVKKPMHFLKITQIINEKWPKTRNIKATTVHNELIADEKFVLVGRGIYGLRDWGYDSRKVEEIVRDILNKNSKMSDKEIIQKVKEKKIVKDSTIRMAIRKYKKF